MITDEFNIAELFAARQEVWIAYYIATLNKDLETLRVKAKELDCIDNLIEAKVNT
jgi:hypothetical protein